MSVTVRAVYSHHFWKSKINVAILKRSIPEKKTIGRGRRCETNKEKPVYSRHCFCCICENLHQIFASNICI